MYRNLDRAVGTSLGYLVLQTGGEVLVTLAGYHREHVGVKYMFLAQYIGILTFALVIDAEAHATSHFLTFLGGVVRILQGAYLKYVRIVPTFLQGGVGEDEAHGFLKAQESLLVLHDEVEGTLVIAVGGASLQLRIDHSAFLVLGEISLMYLFGGIPRVAQVSAICAIRQ